MSWTPNATVTIDGIDYTGETLGRVTITRGRKTVYERAPAGYSRVQLIDLNGTGLPIDITRTINITVQDTSNVDVTVFNGYITDISADIYDAGLNGDPAAIYTVLAVGPLARLSRRVIFATGRPAETDADRIAAALAAGLSQTWEEIGGTWDDLDPTDSWETIDRSFDPALIDAGLFDLAALPAVDGGYSALEVAEEASFSGDGYLYETLDGFIGWDNADTRGTATSYLDIPHDVIRADGLRTSTSVSDLTNRATVEWAAGAETSQDSESIVTYSLFARRIRTTLADGGNASNRADQYVERHAYPAINLDSFSIRLDTVESNDPLIDGLIDATQNTPVNLTGLPTTLGYLQIPGFVEGTTLTLDNLRAELRLNVSDANLSFGSIRWSAVSQSLTWNDLPATLTWEDARSL
jgi:hypothetical protein